MDMDKQLAVQSYCYCGFKENETVVKMVKESGYSAIELCAVHVDFNDESTFDEVISLYQDNGISIVSIGVEGFKNDEASERKRFEFAKKAGVSLISANFSPDTFHEAFPAAQKLADEYDINLAIHNHGGRHWLGCSQILSYVYSVTSPRIGLCLDTGWALHSHEDPVQMAEKFADRLYTLHIKDFVFDKTGQHEDVIVGTGILDKNGLFETLDKNGFSGPVIIEYEGDKDNPVPALKKCQEAMLGQ
jgi:sugar phosphate isomerase/epimerase